MHIPEFVPYKEQESTLGDHTWSVARLIELSKDLRVMEIPLSHLNVNYSYTSLTLREMAMHMRAVESANLEYPIILDEDGEIMDGNHRVMKAMLRGMKTVKAVRFDENPAPCRIKS